MNKAKKKALKQELKTLSSKQKNKLIMHLFGQMERMRKAHELQNELMSSMIESKAAGIFGTIQ